MYWSPRLLVFIVWFAAATTASADVADDDFRVATRQFSSQRWESAAAELAAFVKDHPDDPRAADARYLWGESLVQLRRYPEARDQLLQFLRFTHKHRFTHQAEFRAAEAAFHAADHVSARRELEAFRRRYPDDTLTPYVLAYLGEMALLARDGQTAVALFSDVLQRQPVSRLSAQCRFGLAQAHELLGNVEQSIRFYGESIESSDHNAQQAQFRIAVLRYRRAEYDLAEPLLEQLATAAKGDLLLETRYWLGMARIGQQNWSGAVQALRNGVEASPPHRLDAARRFALAEALRNGGLADEAKVQYTAVFELDPPAEWSDDAGQILAQMALEAGDLPAVVEIATRFDVRYPSSPLAASVRQTRGRALLKSRDFAAAALLFEGLLEEDRAVATPLSEPDDANASGQSATRYYLAIAYLGAGRPADALRVLPAVDNDDSDATRRSDGFRVARASALLALGQYEQAIGPLQAYVSAHPQGADSVDCHAKLIAALGETGQWYAASESFGLFRSRHPDSPTVVMTAKFLADLALAAGVHDVAEPLYVFLAGDESTGDAATGDAATGDAATTDERAPHPVQALSRERILDGLAGLARSQFDRGLFPETALTTARLLALAPPPQVAAGMLFLQGRAFEADAQPEPALESYRQIYETDPMCEQASLALFAGARILASQGKREDACERLEQLIRQDAAFDHRDGALYQLAWLRFEMGDAARADAHFAQLVNEHPASPLWADAAFRLARNAASRKDVAQARHWVDELLFGVARNPVPALATTRDPLANSPTAATDVGVIVCHALYLQGKIAVDEGDWLGALQSYQQLVEEYPQADLADAALFWSAEAQFHLGQYEQADAMLARQQHATPDNQQEFQAMIPLRRAQIAAHRQQWQEALDTAQLIGTRFPNFSLQFEADYLIGRCLSSQARFAMARHSFRQVINSPQARHTETAAMAQWMIGETYFHQSNYEEAIRAYYRVDALYDLPQWQAAALLQAAKCHELNDQWKEAHQLYLQLCSNYPATTFAAEATRRLRVATRNRGD